MCAVLDNLRQVRHYLVDCWSYLQTLASPTRFDDKPVSEVAAPTKDLYKAVSSNRMSEAIVEQIRGLIRSEQLRPGDRLPSERDLGERMGVSRVTIREAMRVLEAGGLIEIRVGARGG